MIKLLDRKDGYVITVLDDYEGLEHGDNNPGGYDSAKLRVKRPIKAEYPEFARLNPVVMTHQGETAWEGYVDSVAMSIKPDTITVGFLGWSSSLKQDGLSANLAAQKGSAFITGEVLTADKIPLAQGNIDDTGEVTVPALLDVKPYKTFNNLLNVYLSFNERWRWWVGPGQKLNWGPMSPTPVYYVSKEHCDTLTIEPSAGEYANWVTYNYTPDGKHYIVKEVHDQDEIDLVERKVVAYLNIPGKCSTADAQAYAEVYLAEHLAFLPRANFTTRKVFNKQGSEVPLALVKSGVALRLLDFISAEILLENMDQVDELATVYVKSVRYRELPQGKGILTVTPTEPLSSLDHQMAMLQTRGY